MAGEAFGFGDADGLLSQGYDGCRFVLLDGDELDVIHHTQAAADGGHAACGQGVIGAGDVVSQWLRGEWTDEDRAGVANPREIGLSVDGEVLGGETIRNVVSLVCTADNDGVAVVANGFTGDCVGPCLPFDFGNNGTRQCIRCSYEYGKSVGIVLGLVAMVSRVGGGRPVA